MTNTRARVLARLFCKRSVLVRTSGGIAAYLETDKARNVGLYQRFGFEVVGEQAVLGMPNWFMRRTPSR
jgi:hypothetical protein